MPGRNLCPMQVWQDMRGKSWKPNQGCASRDRLVLLTVPFRDFAGRPATGELVVAKSVAAVLARIFTEIYDSAAFRIERMDRVDKYGGSDTASMAANNTSAFNCRPVEGTTTLSAHASGLAVDINPVQNPWVKGNEVDPEAGRPFDTGAQTTSRSEPGPARHHPRRWRRCGRLQAERLDVGRRLAQREGLSALLETGH